MKEYKPEDVIHMTDVLNDFYNDVSYLIKSQSDKPAKGSLAYIEQESNIYKEYVLEIMWRTSHLLEVAGDHLTAFIKTLTPPVQTIAPWTCVRSILEVAAFGVWVLDEDIDIKERVKRIFAIQYEELIQQKKFIQSVYIGKSKKHLVVQPCHRTRPWEMKEVESLIVKLENEAVEMGFEPVRDKKNKRDGVGQSMPSNTDLIKVTLNEEPTYRLLSAIVHGDFWAINKISYSQQPENDEIIDGIQLRGLDKTIKNDMLVFIIKKAFSIFAKQLLVQFKYCGWELNKLDKILNGSSNHFNNIK